MSDADDQVVAAAEEALRGAVDAMAAQADECQVRAFEIMEERNFGSASLDQLAEAVAHGRGWGRVARYIKMERQRRDG